jgi:hypothetical protein
MRHTFILVSLFLYSITSIGQKKLSIYKSFGGVVYELDSTTISARQVNMLLKQNPEAYAEFKIARNKSKISSILGFTGGLLVALPLVTAVAGGEPEWIFAGAGAALILISLPFNWSSRGHALNAVESYNLHPSSSGIKVHPSIRFTGTSASLIIRF